MRMSCNGCRVLRKGCSEDCTIRPCLQWIKSPEAQGNATVFLAKFYGRAGLLNLIGAGPDHLRPGIFRSLLYEACGRMVNPIFGSVGLLWSNNWQLCQSAVDAVLQGAPIIQIPSEKAASIPMQSLKSFDIRHVSKKSDADADASDVHKVAKNSRTAFKRAGSTTSSNNNKNGSSKVMRRQESSGSHESCGPTSSGGGSMVSVETVEGEPSTPEQQSDDIQLDLTLGLGSTATANMSRPPSSLAPPPLSPMLSVAAAKRVGLALDLPE